MREGALVGVPAVGSTGEIDMRDGLFEHRQLQRQRAAGVEHEAAAVEDLIVLPADEVEIDQRQTRLDHPRDHEVLAGGDLAAVMRRAVGHQQHLRAGFGQRLGDILVPGILANRAADAHRADGVGPGDIAAGIDALFVEDRLVGQVVLEHAGGDAATLQDVIGVVQGDAFERGAADGHRGAVGAVAGEAFDVCDGGLMEGRFHHQILRVVAGDEHLGESHHVRAGLARRVPRGFRAGGVARQIAHRRVELCQCQAEPVSHAHAPLPASPS